MPSFNGAGLTLSAPRELPPAVLSGMATYHSKRHGACVLPAPSAVERPAVTLQRAMRCRLESTLAR